jgi:hypothetical protein
MTYQAQQEIAIREKVFETITHIHDHIFDVRSALASDVIDEIRKQWPACTLHRDELDYYIVEWESQNPLH